jgi:hypothetical protein
MFAPHFAPPKRMKLPSPGPIPRYDPALHPGQKFCPTCHTWVWPEDFRPYGKQFKHVKCDSYLLKQPRQHWKEFRESRLRSEVEQA